MAVSLLLLTNLPIQGSEKEALPTIQYDNPQISAKIAYYSDFESVGDMKAHFEKNYPELAEIINCESTWRPEVCNAEFGCGAGQGLAQFIPSTWKWIQKMDDLETDISKKIYLGEDPFNFNDNGRAAIWLYERQGVRPWESSMSCWQK